MKVDRRGVFVTARRHTFLLLKSGTEGYGPHEPRFLMLIRDDFRDVLAQVRWPRDWWPK